MGFYRPLEDIVAERKRWAQHPHPRIPTGYPIFDSRTSGGIAEGQFMLFMARTSVGKTWFLLNIIANNPETPTVLFSLEMHGHEIAQRLAGITAGVRTDLIEQRLREDGNSPALDDLVGRYPKLAIIDRPAMSLKDMGAAIEEVTEEWGEKPRFVGIDFLELIGGIPSLSSVESTDKAAMKCKQFARQWDVALCVLHQVGRGAGGGGNQPLSLDSGRYGGEQHADYVLGAYRPCLEPGLSPEAFERAEPEYHIQFLKTRASGGILPSGVRHRIDPGSGRITVWSPAPSSQQQELAWHA